METSKLPVSLSHAKCPTCNLPTSFPIFESGAGGDFSTYIGTTTKNIYRIDLLKIHYKKLELLEVLAPAIKIEEGINNLRKIPEQLWCNVCDIEFEADSIPIDGEEIIDAIQL